MSADRPHSLVAGDQRHGTYYGYAHFRCRCEPCRDAMRAYGRRRLQRQAERGDRVVWSRPPHLGAPWLDTLVNAYETGEVRVNAEGCFTIDVDRAIKVMSERFAGSSGFDTRWLDDDD